MFTDPGKNLKICLWEDMLLPPGILAIRFITFFQRLAARNSVQLSLETTDKRFDLQSVITAVDTELDHLAGRVN